MFKSKSLRRNVQEIRFDFSKSNKTNTMLLLSDIHFDNPKCNRELLKTHLDQALERNAAICVFGDFFCCMMGSMDPRKSRGPGAVRPEDDYPNYFDRIVKNAADWWKPYAKNLVVICPGNHETAILKRQEIDLIDRLCCRLRESGGITAAGGYGNFIRVYLQNKNHRTSNTIYSHHGYGSGGAWSRQTTAFLKYLEQVEADIYIAGHIHKKECFPVERAYLSPSKQVLTKPLHFIRCGTYKNEFIDGAGGWSVEKGIGPRPLGGYWLEFTFGRRKGLRRKIYET